MANVFTGGGRPIALAKPNINSVSITAVSPTEFSFVFPQDTKAICLINIGDAEVEYAYISGGPFFPLRPGQVYDRASIRMATSMTMYFRSIKTGQTIKIDYWQ